MYQTPLRHAGQLIFDLVEGRTKSSAAMRIRRSLVENLLALQFQRLALSFFVAGCGRSLPSALSTAQIIRLPVRKLFLDRFAFPTTRHTSMLMPILA